MKIVLATGGSGGHIFPALQTAHELKKRGHEVVFAGALTSAQAKIEAAGFSCRNISVEGFQDRSALGTLRFAVLMLGAIRQSFSVVRQTAADKIVGFGGYGSFPVLVAGCCLGVPAMIHEQNVKPGKANQVLKHLVKKVAVSFQESLAYFGPKAVWTGCPCHDVPSTRSREEICRTFGLDPGGRIIVLLGGSQGSQRLNQVFFETMSVLAKEGKVQAIHMTGRKEFELYEHKYRQAQLPVKVCAFISPIEDLYAVVDVLITRAGAATVSELGAFAVPAVLVPYPYAGGHQKYNAQVLSQRGAALLLEQNDLSAPTLIEAVGRLNAPEFSRASIKQKSAGRFMENAAARLADAIELNLQ